MIIRRDFYINKLIRRMNNHRIKTITGLRRSGKSFLLFNLFVNYLLDNNVRPDHIIKISLDEDENKKYINHELFINFIKEKIADDKTYYVLIDEIQYMDNFEPVLIQLSKIENLDIYVTGSNSKFLSNDISTMLRGKNDPIHVYPLSLIELNQIIIDKNKAWDQYFKFGGLPYLSQINQPEDKIEYLDNIFNEVYLKDLIERNTIKHKMQFIELIKYVASCIGCLTNSINLSNNFKSREKSKITSITIDKYLDHLKNAFLINEVERFDVKGGKIIGATKKYYFEDIGIRNSIVGYRQDDISTRLENIIFNELKRRGFQIKVGQISYKEKNNLSKNYIKKWSEIDFVASFYNKTYYIQVTNHLDNQKIKERELKPFKKINNCNKRIIITNDNIPSYTLDDGTTVLYILDFLLDENSLEK